ncbi:MAG: cupredoxin domain-containing protein [Actinomycetota bacterium]|nr:cupredoxin domain-containing protein [Actinomycetota bacterium]
MKQWRWSVLVPVLVLFATACSSSSTSSPSSAPPAPPAGASSATGDVSVALNQWSVTPNTTTFSAGPASFTVTNQGTMDHEFVVLRTKTQVADIPVTSFEGESGRINEDTAGTNVGETGDLAAGATKSVTVDLKPGHYVFFCNLPGHYQSGMHVDVTVS